MGTDRREAMPLSGLLEVLNARVVADVVNGNRPFSSEAGMDLTALSGPCRGIPGQGRLRRQAQFMGFSVDQKQSAFGFQCGLYGFHGGYHNVPGSLLIEMAQSP
jgi:hypothetical protein